MDKQFMTENSFENELLDQMKNNNTQFVSTKTVRTVKYVNGEKITGTLEKREEEVISNGITPPTTRMANNNIEFLYELRNPEQIILQDSVIRIVLRQSDLADIIGLTANVLKKDVEILGVTGTYTGE